jgi:hypothetical protein
MITGGIQVRCCITLFDICRGIMHESVSLLFSILLTSFVMMLRLLWPAKTDKAKNCKKKHLKKKSKKNLFI